MAKRKFVDWDTVEPLFRSGHLSNSEICNQYEADHVNSQVWKTTLSEAAVRKRAKEHGWLKNIADQVKVQVKENLVREDLRSSNLQGHSLIEKAAEGPTQVRMLQRKRAVDLANLGDSLAVKLKFQVDFGLDKDTLDKVSMKDIVKVFGALVVARERLQKMESTAFGLDEPETEAVRQKEIALAEVLASLPGDVREAIRQQAAALLERDGK